MKKIPTLFVRDEATNRKYVRNEVAPAAKWVLDGEGEATRKWDGTCCLQGDDLRWFVRREIKPGRSAPPNFVEADHDETTGKTVGWEPAEQSGYWKYLEPAIDECENGRGLTGGGTYELCGPHVNGNPEHLDSDTLIQHGAWPLDAPRDFDGLRDWLQAHDYEGIVWHHPDGRMAKLKKRDFPAAERR